MTRDDGGLDKAALDRWITTPPDDDDMDYEGDDMDYDEGEQPHVHVWSNATGVLGERWCLDCDWLLMPDGTLIQ